MEKERNCSRCKADHSTCQTWWRQCYVWICITANGTNLLVFIDDVTVDRNSKIYSPHSPNSPQPGCSSNAVVRAGSPYTNTRSAVMGSTPGPYDPLLHVSPLVLSLPSFLSLSLINKVTKKKNRPTTKHQLKVDAMMMW